MNSPTFLRALFRFRRVDDVSADGMKAKMRDLSRRLHPDRMNHNSIPSKVKYVCAQVLAGCRYFQELYLHLKSAKPPPSIDPPSARDLPAYNSKEFIERVGLGVGQLTQDPFVRQATPAPPGNTVGARASPANAPNDPDGLDLPDENSAFDITDFNPDSIPNSIEALDLFNLHDTFLNGFTSMKRIPTSAMEDWARAYSLVAQMLLDACKLEPSDPS